MTTIAVRRQDIETLDISAIASLVDNWLEDGQITAQDPQIHFDLDYPLEETDPRELSEIPEVRLWFLRVDSCYPWLPYLLDWQRELARYAAMVVPHQFHRTEGIQFNPEALELFVMGKMFVIYQLLLTENRPGTTKLKLMAQTLGYDIDDGFFAQLS